MEYTTEIRTWADARGDTAFVVTLWRDGEQCNGYGYSAKQAYRNAYRAYRVTFTATVSPRHRM